MTANPAGAAVSVRQRPRARWRAYLLLSRVSNVPTVWSNVLAGMCLASAALDSAAYLRLALSMSAFYTAGMFLNDAFDEPFDRRHRPERPIPAGDVSRGEVLLIGAALMLAGEALLVQSATASIVGALLAAAILLYNYRHKGSRFAPLVMGACRGLVYCAAAAYVSTITTTVGVAAVIMAAYVAGLTVVAKLAGPSARWLVPTLIAAISLVDAAIIATVSSLPSLALVAAVGFPLTLFLQRFVPGD